MEVQTGETGKGDDLAELGRLFGAMVRRVLAQGQVHSVVVVPVAKLTQQALGVPFVQHDQVVETLAAESANHPLPKAFICGACTAVRISRMPRPLTRAEKASL